MPLEASKGAIASARGFGLIELFIALAVAAILATVAVPSFREISRRMTVGTHTNDLVGALTLAKAEATKRGVRAGVIGGGSSWTASGWTVRVDSNNDNTLTGADDLLRTYPQVDADYTVTSKVTGGNDAQIVFNASGNLTTPATAADLNICRPDHQAAQSAWIHVAASGEITSRRNTAGSPAPGC